MKQFLFSFFIFFLSFTIPAIAQNTQANNGRLIEEIFSHKTEVNIYPNPTSNYLFIEVENDELIKKISVYSILGNTVLEKFIASKRKIKLNLSNIRKGKYLIRITFNDNSSQVKSLIKN